MTTHGAGFRDPADRGAIERRGLGIRVARHVLRVFFYLIITMIALFAGGFIIFYQNVATMDHPANPRADAIVVLTGGYQRIDRAVELLQAGAGTRLLISGVNPATTGNHIRLLTRSPGDLFQCCVDIGHDAQDTTGNATETARWIRDRGYKSIILVTNNYHMPRSMAELQRTDHGTRFIAYPVPTDVSPSELVRNPLLVRTLAAEYVKLLLVVSRDWTGFSI
ncbi:MAG: YdcF family protein [Rhizobium sp.]|nr:YdcF family protein [Rhizobium sp.]